MEEEGEVVEELGEEEIVEETVEEVFEKKNITEINCIPRYQIFYILKFES